MSESAWAVRRQQDRVGVKGPCKQRGDGGGDCRNKAPSHNFDPRFRIGPAAREGGDIGCGRVALYSSEIPPQCVPHVPFHTIL